MWKAVRGVSCRSYKIGSERQGCSSEDVRVVCPVQVSEWAQLRFTPNNSAGECLEGPPVLYPQEKDQVFEGGSGVNGLARFQKCFMILVTELVVFGSPRQKSGDSRSLRAVPSEAEREGTNRSGDSHVTGSFRNEYSSRSQCQCKG